MLEEVEHLHRTTHGGSDLIVSVLASTGLVSSFMSNGLMPNGLMPHCVDNKTLNFTFSYAVCSLFVYDVVIYHIYSSTVSI